MCERIDFTPENVLNGDWNKLLKFARVGTQCLQKNDFKEKSNIPLLVGGVALRTLEDIAGLNQDGIFSGMDTDVLLLSTNEELRALLEYSYNRDWSHCQVDVHRLIQPSEEKKTIFRQIVEEDGILKISCLGGRYSQEVGDLEFIQINLAGEQNIYIATPRLLFHLYATRIPGGPKTRDRENNKFQRLRHLNRALREGGIDLKTNGQYKGWRTHRKKTGENHIARAIISAVNLNDKIGRPWERLGFATKIK